MPMCFGYQLCKDLTNITSHPAQFWSLLLRYNMSFAVIGVAVLAIVIALRLVEEHGLTLIGLAPHRIYFPGPSAVPFFGNLLEVSHRHPC